MYVITIEQVTEARHAIDGKRHKHKLYLYPIPDKLRDLGFTACWDRGKKGALRFCRLSYARKIARRVGGKVEEA